MNRTEDRITDLEVKLTFTEDLVERLNDEVTRQAQELDELRRAVAQLGAQLAASEPNSWRSLRDELPPHY